MGTSMTYARIEPCSANCLVAYIALNLTQQKQKYDSLVTYKLILTLTSFRMVNLSHTSTLKNNYFHESRNKIKHATCKLCGTMR
jgi:hypothetical protein